MYEGSQHTRDGVPCHDAFIIGRKGPESWIVVADGLGSANYAQEGSWFLVNEVNRILCSDHIYQDDINLEKLFFDLFPRIRRFAERKNESIIQFASTLQVVLFDEEKVRYSRIGDGGAMVKSNGQFRFLSQAPIYRRPHFFGSQDWDLHISSDTIEAKQVEGLIVFTDGMNDFVYDDDQKIIIQANAEDMLTRFTTDSISRRMNIINTIVGQTMLKEMTDDRTFVVARNTEVANTAAELPPSQLENLDTLTLIAADPSDPEFSMTKLQESDSYEITNNEILDIKSVKSEGVIGKIQRKSKELQNMVLFKRDN